jgi:hypothetical protein
VAVLAEEVATFFARDENSISCCRSMAEKKGKGAWCALFRFKVLRAQSVTAGNFTVDVFRA